MLQKDFSSMGSFLILIKCLKVRCGNNHKWTLASRLVLSSGEQKIKISHIRFSSRLYELANSIARLDKVDR